MATAWIADVGFFSDGGGSGYQGAARSFQEYSASIARGQLAWFRTYARSLPEQNLNQFSWQSTSCGKLTSRRRFTPERSRYVSICCAFVMASRSSTKSSLLPVADPSRSFAAEVQSFLYEWVSMPDIFKPSLPSALVRHDGETGNALHSQKWHFN
eukprot:TRINITY_DN9238_c0_g1_i1.p2 TRINITY_DN9238_c0_g1~~TRINITY_DN9238_c0_g1_i1.p2  ORF type:complete len:155 (+),score=6.56 TRINITY_DN9238_c0_g1_i1:1104-1568(+)